MHWAFIMFFERIFSLAVVAGFVTASAACSNSTEKAAESEKKDPEAACEHMNSVCESTQGYKKFDCSNTNADYEKLDATQKAQVDSSVPCVMVSASCQSAINCVRAQTDNSTSDAGTTPSHTVQDACEHINDVCKGESGFQTQDCSHSNADYQNLSANDKQLADSVTPCVMDATSCTTAFKCLKLN